MLLLRTRRGEPCVDETCCACAPCGRRAARSCPSHPGCTASLAPSRTGHRTVFPKGRTASASGSTCRARSRGDELPGARRDQLRQMLPLRRLTLQRLHVRLQRLDLLVLLRATLRHLLDEAVALLDLLLGL